MYKSTFMITVDEAERVRLQVRTSELAVLAGRRSFDITQEDYEKAKREFRNSEAARHSR
jgi:hypothetical protein